MRRLANARRLMLVDQLLQRLDRGVDGGEFRVGEPAQPGRQPRGPARLDRAQDPFALG